MSDPRPNSSRRPPTREAAPKPGPQAPSPPWFAAVYSQLRSIAERYFTDERRGKGAHSHTLSPTALVHEAYLKLSRAEQRGTLKPMEEREFFPAAARAMREILVDHARRRRARLAAETGSEELHRGMPGREQGTRILDLGPTRAMDVLDLDAALTGLEARDADAAKLVSLRYFVGLSVEEAANVMGVGKTTAEGLWRFARAWLLQRLESGEEGAGGPPPSKAKVPVKGVAEVKGGRQATGE